MIKNDLLTALADMEVLSKAIGIEPFDLYLLGGSGCIIAGYLNRATRDFDIVELDYPSKTGRVLKLLEPFDMIDPQMATLADSYAERAVRLKNFEYLRIYVLSREDIIVSKLGRYSEQDSLDIKNMLPLCEAEIIYSLIIEVLDRTDIASKAKKILIENTLRMMKACDMFVPDNMQQLEKLRELI